MHNIINCGLHLYVAITINLNQSFRYISWDRSIYISFHFLTLNSIIKNKYRSSLSIQNITNTKDTWLNYCPEIAFSDMYICSYILSRKIDHCMFDYENI